MGLFYRLMIDQIGARNTFAWLSVIVVFRVILKIEIYYKDHHYFHHNNRDYQQDFHVVPIF